MECFDCGEEITDETATEIDVGGVVEMVVCSSCHGDPDYSRYTPDVREEVAWNVESKTAEPEPEEARKVFAAHAAGDAGFVDVDLDGDTLLQYHDGAFNVVDVGGDTEDSVESFVEESDDVEFVPHDGRVEVARRGSVEDDVHLCRRLLDDVAGAELGDVVLRTE